MNPASMAIEATKVTQGRLTFSDAVLYLMVGLSVDAYLNYRESGQLFDNIFIPAGSEELTFIILIVCSILIPFCTSLVFKENSKARNGPWEGKYIATLFASMILTPTVSLLIDTMIVAKYFPEIDGTTYIVVLLITMLIVAYGTQKVLGEGIKALTDQLVGVKEDLKYAEEQLKKP